MAVVKPFRALRYDTGRAGPLEKLIAPPFDVIGPEERARYLRQSPYNVVHLTLPDSEDEAGRLFRAWRDEGVLVSEEDRLWALTQDYVGSDGNPLTRHGFLARVRVTEYGPGLIRPHERTQPGPKEDRLRLTEATRHNLSPIFALYAGSVWNGIEPRLDGEPWGEVTDPDSTVHRVWRIADPSVHEAVRAGLADAELLIADGHHRYETARTYAEKIGGDGSHRYTLACLVSLEDPGLTILATHRMLRNLDSDAEKRLANAIREQFEVTEVAEDDLDPAGSEGVGVFGYRDARSRGGFRLRLKDPAALDEALAGRSEAYRRLDAAILEELVLKPTLGLGDENVAAKRGIGYAKDAGQALRLLDAGEYQAAFLLRPTPVEQVREIAAAGETMPPKSTYFFPKLLTGLVFNPLA